MCYICDILSTENKDANVMPMPQVNIRLPDELVEKAEDHRHSCKIRSMQKTYVRLIVEGLVAEGALTEKSAEKILQSEDIPSRRH